MIWGRIRESTAFWSTLSCCAILFLLLSVQGLLLLVSGLVQLLLEVSVSEMLGDFHTTDINFGGGGDDKFLVCSTQRDSIKGQRS